MAIRQLRRRHDVGDVEWQNSTLLQGNLAQGIAALKQRSGKTIGVAGSGKRLFNDGGDLKRLKLVDSKMTRTGVSIVTYVPA